MDTVVDVTTLTKEQLMESFKMLSGVIDSAETEITAIKKELESRMTTDSEVIGEHSITKAKRVSFKTKLSEAKELGAVCEAVDTKKLKELHNAGVSVPGVQVTEYLTIRNIAEKGDK